MRKPKFKLEQRVWFLKSMRLCKVVEVIPATRRSKNEHNYIVEIVQPSPAAGNQLYASEDGLVLESEYVPEGAN